MFSCLLKILFHFILNTDIRGKDSVPGITKKQWGTTLCSKILKVNGILVLHQMQEKYFRMVKQSLINTFTPKISLLILLTVYHTILTMLVLIIWYQIK